MKHKHYEMIVAKAANVELVAFCKQSDEWVRCSQDGIISWSYDLDYFLCLPQHKEACLHWLNGGEIQDYYNGEWTKIKCHDGNPDWNEPDQLFMNEDFELRIAPRKEKRWIGYYNYECTTERSYKTKSELIAHVKSNRLYEYCAPEKWQIIEIEIEV